MGYVRVREKHLQDNRAGCRGGLPEMPGNPFCIWVRLV